MDEAEAMTNRLMNSSATVEMLDPGEEPTATVTQTQTSTKFDFQIPKSNVAYATFEVDQTDGCLYMYTPTGFDGIDFI